MSSDWQFSRRDSSALARRPGQRESANPFDASVCIPEASAGSPVQVYANGNLIQEVTSAGMVSCPLQGGTNLIEAVRSSAPLVAIPSGPLIDTDRATSSWITLYPKGKDPFASGEAKGSPIATGRP